MSTRTKPPYFRFFPSDFIVGTSFFSAEETGVYIRLLCYQWEHGGLPDDDAVLCRLGGCHGINLALVRTKFQRGDDGLLRNQRLEQVRGELEKLQGKQANNAAKGWEKRRMRTGEDAAALPPQESGNAREDAKPVPETCLPKPKPNIPPIVPQEDDGPPPADVWDEDKEICRVVWEGHPAIARQRSSRDKVAKEWQKVPKRDRPTYEQIVASLELWRKSSDWLKDGGQFVAGCHRWVKERKWTVTPVTVGKGDDPLGRTLRSDEVTL